MLKGALALVIRISIYAIGGAVTWTGAVTMTGAENLCMNIPAFADAAAGAAGLLIGGPSLIGGAAIWSRWVRKQPGGIT